MAKYILCIVLLCSWSVAQGQRSSVRFAYPENTPRLSLSGLSSAGTRSIDSVDENARSDASIYSETGLLFSAGYKSLAWEILENRGYAVSGLGAFYNLELGFEFRVQGHFFVIPRLRYLFTPVNTESDFSNTGGGVSKLTSMFTYGLGGRYYLVESRPSCVYVQGEFCGFSASSDLFGVSSDGPGTGIVAGYEYGWRTRSIGLEMGYLWMPVDISASEVNASAVRRDFGGFYVCLVGRFQMFNYTGRDDD